MRSVEKCPRCSDDPEASQFHTLCQREAAIYAIEVRKDASVWTVRNWDKKFREVPDANLVIRMRELEESCAELGVGMNRAHNLFKRNQEFLVGREADKWYRDVSRWLESNWPMLNADFILKKAMLQKAVRDLPSKAQPKSQPKYLHSKAQPKPQPQSTQKYSSEPNRNTLIQKLFKSGK